METLKPYIGSYMDTSVFLNHGKYGYYLKHNDRLYSVPQCFQKPDFGLQDAIKIIEYKKKMKEQQIENRKDFQDDNDIIKQLDSHYASLAPKGAFKEPNGVSKDVDEIITKLKSKKKVLN